MGNVRALAEAVATFDQVFQPLGEARCRSPVDDRVIETQGHAEIFADRSRQTSDDERRERQGLPGFRFVVPKVRVFFSLRLWSERKARAATAQGCA